MVLVDGQVKLLMQRLEAGDGVAIVDWVNFSVHESTIFSMAPGKEKIHFLASLSNILLKIFGLPLGDELPRGRNFYSCSWGIGPNAQLGFLGWGGQANSVGFSLNGTGCSYFKPGWENRLETFLHSADGAQISRVDLAHDDFNGDRFCIEGVIHAYHHGFFNNGGRIPKIELRGNHIRPDGRGRTVYLGSRENMLFRGYEKGKQLGDSDSNWFRCEVEIHHSLRLIPFDILTSPGRYLAATYPFLNGISKQQCRLHTRKKVEDASFDKMKNWLRHQCGSSLSLMVAVEGPEKTLEFLQKDFRDKASKIFPGVVLNSHQESSLPSAAPTGQNQEV